MHGLTSTIFCSILMLIQTISFGLCYENETSKTWLDPNATLYLNDTWNQSDTPNGNTTHRKYAFLYTNLRIYFLKWYLPLVVGVGTFGTVFCLVFLFLSRLFPANMLLWLVSICVGDFLILVMEGIWMLLKVWLNYDIRDINNVACVIHTSFSNYLYYWSAYMQCLLSMQRAYLIIRPLRARGSGPNMKCLLAIWTSVSVLLVIPMLPYSLYWRVINGDCDPPRESLFRITTLSDFIIWSLIPLIGMTSATAIICWNIFRIRRNFRSAPMPSLSHNTSVPSTFTYLCPPSRSSYANRLYPPVSIPVTNPQYRILSMLSQHNIRASHSNPRSLTWRWDKKVHPGENTASLIRPLSGVQNSQGQRHGATDNAGHVTRLLICMNIWYMISTYPLMIYLMFLNFIVKDMDRDVHKFMYYLSRSLCFLNACSNWIFYCASGRLFRQRIKQICRRFLSRFRFYSGSQSSGMNDYQINCARYPSNVMRDRYTMYSINGTLGNRCLRPNRKVFSAENLHLSMHHSHPQLKPTTLPMANSNRSRFITFLRKLLINCHAFQCHCFCTKPLPCVVHSLPTESRTYDDEGKDSMSHGTVFVPRTTVASEHVCECEACCTGFCCWKFWWYGFSGGLMKDETFYTTTPVDKLKIHSFVLTSSSSSSHFHSEVIRHHSHLRVRPNTHHNHHQHHHLSRKTRSDDRVRELEPVSSCIRDSKVSWGLPENKLKHNSQAIRSNTNMYGSAPSTLIEPNQVRKSPDAEVTHLTIHTQPTNEMRTSNTIPTRPMCYCYMSSLGKRQYHYHYCKLHENGQTQQRDRMNWRSAPHHPFTAGHLHTAKSEGRILRALEGNRDEFLSLPPADQRSVNMTNHSLAYALDISN